MSLLTDRKDFCLNSAQNEAVVKLKYGDDNGYMCYPMVFTNLRTFGSIVGPSCPQNWEVQVPQDEDFESWFSDNVIFWPGNDIFPQTFTGAVGML